MGRLHTGLACALAIAAVPALAFADEPSPVQKIAITAKPSVVRVYGAYLAKFDIEGTSVPEAIGGTGTGWFMTGDGYIATNAHVVAEVQAGDDAAKKKLTETLYDDLNKRLHDTFQKMSQAQINQLQRTIRMTDFKALRFVVLPNGDKLDYDIKEFGKPGGGNDAAIIKVKIDHAPTLPIGDSTKSLVEDHVVVIGYPGVADMTDLLDEKSQLEASVTDGAISSLKRAASGEQILQISAPITHGNSGGPAIDQHGNVIGLATFGNEGEVQGFNFLVASATLMEMVKHAKLDPKPSDTNKAWSEGLEHYWADEYTDAIKSFEEVEALFPQHSEAGGYIRNANLAKKDGKEKKVESNTGLVVGLVIGGVVLAGLAVMMIRRNKRPPQPMGMPMHGGPMPGMMPQPMPGMSSPMNPQVQVPPSGPPGMPPPMYGGPQQQMYGRAPQAQPAPAPGQYDQVAKTIAVARGAVPAALTVVRGALAGQRFPVAAGGIVVGRQPGVAHVLVNDHRASGKHVWIGFDNNQLVAIDQGTTNGTYVNDMARGRITRAELRDGDTVIVSEPDCCSLQIKLGG